MDENRKTNKFLSKKDQVYQLKLSFFLQWQPFAPNKHISNQTSTTNNKKTVTAL